MPTPEDTPKEIEQGARFLGYIDDLVCDKLRMCATACHGCPDNPHNGAEREHRTQSLKTYGRDLEHIVRLYDAAKMGLVHLSDIDAEDFERLRMFWGAVERKRHATNPLPEEE